MPYLVHPDKVLAINELVKRANAGMSAQKKKRKAAMQQNPQAQSTGSPLIDSLAQQLFMKRQMKQKGLM